MHRLLQPTAARGAVDEGGADAGVAEPLQKAHRSSAQAAGGWRGLCCRDTSGNCAGELWARSRGGTCRGVGGEMV
jgi:hypothetical protein